MRRKRPCVIRTRNLKGVKAAGMKLRSDDREGAAGSRRSPCQGDEGSGSGDHAIQPGKDGARDASDEMFNRVLTSNSKEMLPSQRQGHASSSSLGQDDVEWVNIDEDEKVGSTKDEEKCSTDLGDDWNFIDAIS